MNHLLTALLLTSTLIAMEEVVVEEEPNELPLALSEEAQNSRLFIKNFTEQPLLIKYVDNEKRLKRVVRKNNILYLCSPLLLSSVKVFPYGKYRGNVNIESMTGGIAKQPDNAGEILTCIIKETPLDIFLNVQPHEGFGSTLLPFYYSVNSKPKGENYDLPTSLKEVFPHVKKLVIGDTSIIASFTSPGTITSRYFLNIPEGSSEESIKYAYKAMKLLWEQQNDELGKVVNNLLDTSYKILIDGIRLQEEEDTLHKLASTLFARNKKEEN